MTETVVGFEALATRGQALAAQLDYAGAIDAMRRALALRPDEHWLRVNLARALFARRRAAAV